MLPAACSPGSLTDCQSACLPVCLFARHCHCPGSGSGSGSGSCCSWSSLLLTIFACVCVCALAHSFLQLFFEFPFWTRYYVLSNCATRMSQRLHLVTRVWLCRGMRVHWLDYQHSQSRLSLSLSLPRIGHKCECGAMRHKAEQWTKDKLASKWPRHIHQLAPALATAPAKDSAMGNCWQIWWYLGAYNLIGIQPITFIIRATCERGIICSISISFMFYSIASILCGIWEIRIEFSHK